MKTMILSLVLALFSTAQAAVQKFEICNQAGADQKVTIELAKDKMKVTIASEATTETQELVIEKSVVASANELKAISTSNNLVLPLTEGTVYLTSEGAYFIAQNANQQTYLFLVMGGSVLLLGDTSSCQ